MKKKAFPLLLVAEAGILAALTLLAMNNTNYFSSVAAFPFEQIARFLARLSRSEGLRNGIAVALWFGIAAVPALIALLYRRGRETLLERISLFVLSGVLLFALYGMAAPHAFSFVSHRNVEEAAGWTKAIREIFGVSVWAVIMLYVFLLIIRLFRQGDKEQLLKYMRMILYALCMVFTAVAAVLLTKGSLSFCDVPNTAIDKGFAAVRLAAQLIPYLFDIIIIIRLLDLLHIAMEEEQAGMAEATEKVSRICCTALGVTATVTAFINIIQVLFMEVLTSIYVTADIPVVSMAFVILILLLVRLLIENKKLRDDNSLFI